MIVVDANVLIYAYNITSPEHERCRRWLEGAFNGPEPVLFAWMTILAFLRIITNPRVFAAPLAVAEAIRIVDSWFAQPAVSALNPRDSHWQILSEFLVDGQAKGTLVMDAHLAALAKENGAVVSTTDRDFARFAGVRLLNPIASA